MSKNDFYGEGNKQSWHQDLLLTELLYVLKQAKIAESLSNAEKEYSSHDTENNWIDNFTIY